MARSITAEIEETMAGVDLQKQVQSLKSDIASLTSALSDYARAQRTGIAAAASTGAEILRQKGAHSLDAASDLAGRGYSQAEATVRKNPASAVAVAAGVGFLIGVLSGRR
ncbi:MAG: DUF883 domain-containing protein [bacterium]